ncbi:hypothetical protein BSL78_07982 [Apostichopus japonicus]|uniref:Uncharacterized protein n=1 Tax=Stichopus japonicus TaxID=307972 RepID=A0A2G8L4S2_STIJA|nr:hypothetical protein BSL78_07982 [Apostichopus japonicus]
MLTQLKLDSYMYMSQVLRDPMTAFLSSLHVESVRQTAIDCNWRHDLGAIGHVKPCSNTPHLGIPFILRAGANFTVTFQKNLDHWLKKTPGHFLISLVDGKVESRLAMIPDKGEPNLTLYAKNVTMPSAPLHKPLTLQVIYVTMNHDAPPMFYQCSDIELYTSK